MKLLLKIVLWSVLVGLVLAWTGLSPGQAVMAMVAWLGDVPPLLADLFGWAWPYMREGAVIVVPIVVVGALIRHLRRRRSLSDRSP